MTPEFLAAVIDTLLPGDGGLPSGTAAGLDPAAYVGSHRAVFEAIAARAGGESLFIRADQNDRIAALETVERVMPDAFRLLLVAILSDYYEAPPVLEALGWRSDPPQPIGHAMPELNDLTAERLEHAQRRAKLWRAV